MSTRFPFLLAIGALSATMFFGCSSNVAPPVSTTPVVTAPSETAPTDTSSGASANATETGAPKTATKAAQAISWRATFEKAQAEAVKTRKPMMVDFYTDWCGACKTMDGEAYTNAIVIRETQNFVMVKVNAEQRQDLALRYKVTGYPTLLWLDADGKVLHSSDGYGGVSLLQNDMKTALQKFSTTV